MAKWMLQLGKIEFEQSKGTKSSLQVCKIELQLSDNIDKASYSDSIFK
jgi:hypothetical protein